MKSNLCDNNLKILLMGPPGSGKSTLVAALKTALKPISNFAVRAFFEAELNRRSNIGLEYFKHNNSGLTWLPDEFVCRAVEYFFESGELGNRLIIEGFPATTGQVQWYKKYLAEKNEPMPVGIYIKADKQLCLQRISNRKICPNCENGVNLGIPSSRDGSRCHSCNSILVTRPDDEPTFFNARFDRHIKLQEEISRLPLSYELYIDAEEPVDDKVKKIQMHLSKRP